MSRRVMEVLDRFTHEVDVYSIDEAFLNVDKRTAADPEAMTELGRTIKDALWRLIGVPVCGVPVCVGIAPTRTLAKLANKTAKKLPVFDGVCVWPATRPAWREQLMRRLEGRRTMFKTIARIMNSVVRAPFQDAVAVIAAAPQPFKPALVARPAAGMRVQPRDEILLGDFSMICRGTTGVVLVAPEDFLAADEVVVLWSDAGSIVYKLDTLAHAALTPV
ncbi:hypothetical protein DEI93_02175 [Curtobacterium sp. MCBD17_035]|nr:hypothetical protein [Curtobacterium sp. MCBD17_035]WIB67869.1 hypothetical protein DEI93_02175 [Curtobacterium sp. MCBD17_035]